ncbi:MAG: group 1 glycosyl transferase, partial [Candidatus Eremiobacteraeota bacterium]|nr:group 1 glycosyl transferase [Candidatus Eremiobacteraeota bacterium]
MSGGAEQQSWQLAQHIAGAGYAVDALTTCSASASEEWSRNVLPAGVERAGDVTIKRFRVDKRDPRAFARVNTALTSFPATQVKRSVSPLSEDDAMVFETQNINSEGLLQYLETEGRRYRALIFIPYLYGTTLAGIQLVSERAFLQPCLHNESYAYLPAVRRAFHSARGVLFNSLGELEIAVELYGPGIIKKSSLVG